MSETDEKKPSELTLVSPNGQNSITIKCTDNIAGIWITNGDNKAGVHLWLTNREVGVGVVGNKGLGSQNHNPGYNACISVSNDNGQIQLVDDKGKISFIDVDILDKLKNKLDFIK